MAKISVIIKEPGKNPRHVNISPSLKNLQNTVGGYIETVTLSSDMVIICDEEGRIKNYKHCCTVCGIEFVGTVVFCGIKGDNFSDIPIEFKKFKVMFPGLWDA